MTSSLKKTGGVKFQSSKASRTLDKTSNTLQKYSVIFSQEFEGSEQAIRPQLKWFKHDSEFTSLIKMRCSGKNRIQKYNIEIDATSFSSMSKDLAAKIDFALKKYKICPGLSMKKEIEKESIQKLIFTIEF